MKKDRILWLIQKGILIISIGILTFPIFSHYIDKEKKKTELTQKVSTETESFIKEYTKKMKSSNSFNIKDPFGDKNNIYKKDKFLGIIEIPKIKVTLPIYYGVSDEILNDSVGVLPFTDLPNGGKNTNSVITGHRGVYNQDIFKNINLLEKGNIINIIKDDKKIVYKVTNKEIIAPDAGDRLKREEGKDMITLLTCHPYLINSQRLIVEAERVETIEKTSKDKEETGEETLTIIERIQLLSYREYVIIFLVSYFGFKIVIFLKNKKGEKIEKK